MSISSVYSVTVVFWRVTSSTGLEMRSCEPEEDGLYRSISSLREMSWMAVSSLVLASDSSLEFKSREVSICACLESACFIS